MYGRAVYPGSFCPAAACKESDCAMLHDQQSPLYTPVYATVYRGLSVRRLANSRERSHAQSDDDLARCLT